MHIFTDEQLEKTLIEIPDTHPRSLWEKVDAVAIYLALTGTYGAALTVWKFLFENLPHTQFPHAYSLVAPDAFCHLNKMEDFIGGEKDLFHRVWQHDIEARRDMTIDAWNLAPGHETMPLRNIRQARALARPPRGERYNTTELEALPLLDEFTQDSGVAAFAVYDAHLLYADICYRHEKRNEAIAHLHRWAELSQKRSYITWHAYAIPGLAWLISQKHLEFLTTLSREERQQIALQTVATVRRKLSEGRPTRSETTSLHCSIFYSSFLLEPANASGLELEGIFWEGLQEAPPTDVKYPNEVSVSTPGETGSATFHLKFGEELPNLQSGVFAVTFPFQAQENARRGELDAQIGNVFLSTPTGMAEDIGFEVPPGDYDVAAIFHRSRGEESSEAVGLRHFEVDLWFLPRGNCSQFGVHYDRSWDDGPRGDDQASDLADAL